MGKITPVGIVLIALMVVGFVYGFLGHGEGAGFSLLIAALILLFIALQSFTRGGRAAHGRRLETLVERADEARRAREAQRTRDL